MIKFIMCTVLLAGLSFLAADTSVSAETVNRFDMGTTDSPLKEGFTRITPDGYNQGI